MALEKTDAIILKSFPYGDTSKIARCYTRDFGKISIIGRGVRKGKILQGGYFEPMNYLSLLFYYSPKRQLQTFSKAEFKKVWSLLKNDVKKLSYGFAVVELIDRSVTGEEPHKDLFELLVETLRAINDKEGNINLVFWYYEIHLLSLLGFRPVLSECPRCHSKLKEGYFSSQYGELLCSTCYNKETHFHPNVGDQGFEVSSRAIKIMKQLKLGDIGDVIGITLKQGDRKQVGGFLHNYLKYHIEGIHEIKSLRVLEKLLT